MPLLFALCASGAMAEPGSGPRETVDQTFTTESPGTPTGLGFTGTYHAAGNESGNPPYMRRMVFYPPEGMRYDTSVPESCTATDLQLSLQGPDACPEGSLIGTGRAKGIFFQPIGHAFEFDRFDHVLYIANNANEQIMLVEAEGYSVTRGKIHPDGSIEFNAPTCFPTPPTGQCFDDYVLQTSSATVMPEYTKTTGGGVGSYATTPPECPATGRWETRVHFWWADGAEDDVVTTQPCVTG
jgi:hypothetical protein